MAKGSKAKSELRGKARMRAEIVEAMRGLRQREREVLAQEQEPVEEAPRQLHVVVHDEQPVASVGRVLGEQRVEVLELSAALGRGAVELDMVT